MKKPPCIRNLTEFKKGCPQKTWDGESGCTAWVEMSIATRGNPQQREIKKQCIDMWNFEFTWASLGVMEGVQIATEGDRNMTAMLTLGLTGGIPKDKLRDLAERQLKLE